MAYEPLHHKYRPQTFAQLVGQEAIATTLSNALRQQRIAPAYLFTGPRGTGKTSSARILAKSLNCLQSDVPTDSPCGVCDICQRIARGSALDVIEIDAASNTGVDNIRELIERAQFAPVQCRYKVYIIDEVHMLSTAAFNALLKTLEEPPDRVVFVLATTDPQRVLPTIISRCQRFDYRRIPLKAMVDHLMAIAHTEAIPIQAEAVELVAQIAQGGLRDAESLLDQLSLLEGEISVEKVWDLVGAVPERDLLALVRAIAQDDSTAVLDQARHLMNRGREPLIVLQNLASFYRDLLIAKTAGDRRDLVTLTQPTWQDLCAFAQTIDMPTILLGQQHLRDSEVQLKNTTQPRLWLEITLMGLLPSTLQSRRRTPTIAPPPSSPSPTSHSPSLSPQPHSIPTPSSPTSNSSPSPPETPSSLPPPPSSPPSPSPPFSPPPSPCPPPSPPSPSPPSHPTPTPADSPLAHSEGYAAFQREKLDQTWKQIVAALRPPGTQALLRQQGCLLAFDGKHAQVGISSQPLIRMAQAKLVNIETAFEQVFGTKVTISLEVGAAPSAASSESSSPASNSSSPSSSPSPSHPTADSPIPPPPVEPPLSPASTALSPTADLQSAEPSADSSAEPPIDSYQVPWQDEDDVTKAAKSFAQMFNGQIVDLDNDDVEIKATRDAKSAPPASAPTSSPDVVQDDDDVPF